jgi:PAS domain S-box-containing protein
VLRERLEEERGARLAAENALRMGEEYDRLLLESAPVAISIYSENRFLFSNKAHRKLLGAKDPAELIGKSVLEIIDETCHKVFLDRQEVVLKEKADVPLMACKARRLDGTLIDMETIAIPFIYRGKQAIMGIALDVTQQKRAEEELKLQREQLIRADKLASLGTVASGVAHEISNPNNFIMMNASLLAQLWHDLIPILDKICRDQGEFTVKKMKYSQIRERISVLCSGILEGSKRIKHTVRELKDFARPEEPGINTQVDLNEVVKAAVNLLSNLIRKSTNSFAFKAGRRLPPVKGNFQRLEQVMVNLIVNACQALKDRNGVIQIATFFNAADRRVVVTVQDQGVGIAPENLSRITDPFCTSKRDVGGTGLGLSISSRIIADHGATLRFDSTPGVGTVAEVSFPIPEPGYK